MADKWVVFICSMDDRPASIMVDVAVRNELETTPSSLCKFRLSYKAPRADGLPTRDEYDIACKIEDEIEMVAKTLKSRYVGRITVDGHRDFFIYTDADQECWQDAASQIAAKYDYSIKVSISEDPQHQSYLDNLYPTEDDWQVIGDMRVIENAKKHGDDAKKPRQIDHWAYFETLEQVEQFMAWAIENSYDHLDNNPEADEDGERCVQLKHIGTLQLNDISNRTMALRRAAKNAGGRYDGWETPIVN